jgi:hypothetical protein
MSPEVQFHLDRKGFDECKSLLAAIGMEFVESRRDHLGPIPSGDTSEYDRIFGTLHSPHGVHECFLLSSGRRHAFFVTIKSSTAILDDLSKAFAGHLLDERKPTKA